MAFDSIQIKFKNVKQWLSPLASSRIVPFVESYFKVIKSCINDIRTEYFWVFPSFMSMKQIDLDFIPEQFEKDQIHVWYSGHPKAGLNKEGNVLLIPTKQFKEQMEDLKFLRDYKDINYHMIDDLWYPAILRICFKLKDPVWDYNNSPQRFYKWMINKDLDCKVPDFFPSFWEDIKLYSFGKTNDIMLVPYKENIKQFYEIDRLVHTDYDYNIKPMDIVFLSYDEPLAEERFNKLKAKYPRTKWCKGVKGRTQAYHAAAQMSDTDYFFAVFCKNPVVDTFDFSFQPDRLKNACHYMFDCYNPIIDLQYGHGGVILYNKKLTLATFTPGLDFTLSAPHDSVPILSAISHFNETPLTAWRTAFREVIKLSLMPPSIETNHRLKKWCKLGSGKNSNWAFNGANDAKTFFEKNRDKPKELFKSYELGWLKEYYESKY